MTGVLIESVLKISVILAAALALTALLRRSSAATRHWILAASIVAAAAMPLLQVVAPQWSGPLTAPWLASDRIALRPVTAGTTAANLGVNAPPALATPMIDRAVDARAFHSVLPAIWIAGSVVMLALLAVGLARLVWLTRTAAPIRDGEWQRALPEMLRHADVHQMVTVRESPAPGVLVAWGAIRPQIILPASSRMWPASRVRIVLAHELAHIRRLDWPLQILAELLRAACWFNPLVWIVVGRLRSESERACDDAVMRGGVDGADYAAELLGIATELRGGRRGWLPAPAMARASHLEGRVAAMLNPSTNRTPLSATRRITSFVAAVAVAVGISGYAISAQTFSSLAGSVSDQLGGLVPNATLVLVNKTSGSKYEVKSNSVGLFEFVGLPAGEYSLAASVPGFKTIESTLIVGGETLRRDLSLELGTLQETVRVVGHRLIAGLTAPPSVVVKTAPARRLPSELERVDVRMQPNMSWLAPYRWTRVVNALWSARRFGPNTAAAAQASGAAPACGPFSAAGIGGNIKVPIKIKDVRPVYPENAALNGLDGIVELEATIGPDGTMQLVSVISPMSALGVAALDAVRQWEFTATLLNCVAVNVQMHVRVLFVLED
jgi:TonB family protein